MSLADEKTGLGVIRHVFASIVAFYRSRHTPFSLEDEAIGAAPGFVFTACAVFCFVGAVVLLRWQLALGALGFAVVGAYLWPNEDGIVGPTDDERGSRS